MNCGLVFFAVAWRTSCNPHYYCCSSPGLHYDLASFHLDNMESIILEAHEYYSNFQAEYFDYAHPKFIWAIRGLYLT